MSGRSSFLKSSVGAKQGMAVSGLILFGFIIVHMLGNLTIFAGRDAINAYAVSLRELPFESLWIGRVVLLAALVVHVATAFRLARINRAARPEGYRYRAVIQTDYAARTMLFSGLIILAYVVYHLMHLTFGVTGPGPFTLTDPQGRHDVYSLVVLGFQDGRVAAAYVIANALLCVHLYHGIQSLFQTLGLSNPKHSACIRRLGPAIAVILFLGYVAVPVSVQLGLVTLPAGVQ